MRYTERQLTEIRRAILQHMELTLPNLTRQRRDATDLLTELDADSQKVLDAYDADAIDNTNSKQNSCASPTAEHRWPTERVA